MRFTTGFKAGAALLAFIAASASAAAPQRTEEVEMRDVDRCTVPDVMPVFVRSRDALPGLEAIPGPAVSRGSGNVPDVMVDGWKPAQAPVETMLAELGREAGFRVTGAQGFPVSSWTRIKAPLRETIDTLARNANATWSFSENVLTLSRYVAPAPRFRASLPNDRDARLAFLDIVRGNGADVKVTGRDAIVTGSTDAIGKAKTALTGARQLLVFDVLFMRGRPEAGRYDWAALQPSSSTPANAGGQFMLGEQTPSSIVARLKSMGDVAEDSGQSVATPPGWAIAVPPAQCGRGNGEIMVAPRLSGDQMSLKISGIGFNANFADVPLGSSVLVAASEPSQGWIPMVFIRPRMVTFSN